MVGKLVQAGVSEYVIDVRNQYVECKDALEEVYRHGFVSTEG